MLTGAIGATPSLCLYNVRAGQAALARGPQVAFVRGLALKDWKRPSVEELTVPRESWAKVNKGRPKKSAFLGNLPKPMCCCFIS